MLILIIAVEVCDTLTSPENGQVTLTSRTVGSVATYSCGVGYNLVGSVSRMCQMGSGRLEWSDSEPTCGMILSTLNCNAVCVLKLFLGKIY